MLNSRPTSPRPLRSRRSSFSSQPGYWSPSGWLRARRYAVSLRAELTATVGDVDIELSLEVAAGECLALAGPSGAGKTTILHYLAGIKTPARGAIVCAEEA